MPDSEQLLVKLSKETIKGVVGSGILSGQIQCLCPSVPEFQWHYQLRLRVLCGPYIVGEIQRVKAPDSAFDVISFEWER